MFAYSAVRGATKRHPQRTRRKRSPWRPVLERLEDRALPTVTLHLPTLQAETSVAIDTSGMHVVVGYNQFQGFNTNPFEISGFAVSDDGGNTFTTGALPSPGNQVINGTKFPEIFGDPDVKYLGGTDFVYSSIMVRQFSPTTVVQTMSVHVSTDDGHTWSGPFEVTPATNPHGAVDANGNPLDAADKEFINVDPDTGRVMVTWTNFTPFAPNGTEISSTFSDNILSGAPTWSPRQIVSNTATGPFGVQASIPRFAGNGSNNVYVAWQSTLDALHQNVVFARSTDNGATWGAPMPLTPGFFRMDQVLGNDRINSSPTLAVDNSTDATDAFAGNVYVAYSENNNHDGGDIAFQRSTDGGQTFSAPILLNSRPGADRAQWFPALTVDSNTGRVYVMYYDQSPATSGDLTEVMYTFSDDGGTTWSKPRALTDPFHAAYGNDTSQPNLGDYNQIVAHAGQLFATYAVANRPPLGFADGQPGPSMTVPDVQFAHVRSGKTISVETGAVTFTDSGGNGFIDPGEQITVQVPLRNFVTNPLNASTETGLTATLTTSTPGVTILSGSSAYPNIDPGNTASNLSNFVLQIAPSFVPGTPIQLTLNVLGPRNAQAALDFTLTTGTPSATTIFAENFDGAINPSTNLPPGWSTAHGGGNNVVRWTTNNTFLGNGSNALFHQEAEDGLNGNSTRWERAFSPLITIPANSSYVTLDFDVKYNTQDDPNFNIQAFDGFFVRVTDATGVVIPSTNRTLRSVLTDAFADQFTTGSVNDYTKHLPRSNNPNYFADMSVWAGNSGGILHVHMVLPGMAGSVVQLRFEYTQDRNGVAASGAPGVAVDNIVMRNVVLTGSNTAPDVVAGQLTGAVPNLAPDDPNGQLAAIAGVLTAQADHDPSAPAPDDGQPDPEGAVVDAIAAMDQAFVQNLAANWQEPNVTPKPLDELVDQLLVDILGIGGDAGSEFQV
jgi:hypothetical protein